MRSTQQVIDSLEEALRVRLLEEVVVAVRASEEAAEGRRELPLLVADEVAEEAPPGIEPSRRRWGERR